MVKSYYPFKIQASQDQLWGQQSGVGVDSTTQICEMFKYLLSLIGSGLNSFSKVVAIAQIFRDFERVF